ncbi:unnamed protein product [Triticum turgidum subsp. durum]|uniref:Glycosyltransferase n=1 Tax=Triticum turgidum subsp. durum TaxID=4567 RepID=A0A9R0Y842_TRITD|nr:unnamed protein product [Triticum turgidum subsp. durum]
MPVEDVPGLRSMRLRDFPSFIRTTDPDEYIVHYVLRETERTAGASAVILNSFADLEGESVEAMEALGLPKSLCGGVPVISWPFFADQQTNCRYQCNEWGVGMEIDSNVRRDAVAGLITEIMEGEKGKGMRKRAAQWKDSAVKAAMPGGSSHRNFDGLVRDVLLPKN